MKQMIQDLIKESSEYTGHTKAQLMEGYIKQRLEDSLKQYYVEVNQSSEYLGQRNPVNLSKRINRSL